MDYLELLENSFAIEKETFECPTNSRFKYLAESIFDFTTYDDSMSDLFGRKAVEVCAVINDGKTFDYIEDAENYKWFLLMCNMPFFANKLEWGTSIRGAWWGASPGEQIEFQSCGLWVGDEQCAEPMEFSVSEWRKFVAAVVAFSDGGITPIVAKAVASSPVAENPQFVPIGQIYSSVSGLAKHAAVNGDWPDGTILYAHK